MAAEPLEKKVTTEKYLKDVLKATSLPYTKNSLGIPSVKKGVMGFEQHELSLKNSPESHEFCVFGIHIEH